MPRCLLALGSNLGNRKQTLEIALREISAIPKSQVLARSSWHQTLAVGGPSGQGDFLNGVVLVDTEQDVLGIASRLHSIEKRHGRERKVRWAARTLDIDLLLCDDETINTPDLTIPHPRMSFRQFVLNPAAEIAGYWVVPETGWTIRALSNHLRTATRYVAITAADTKTANWLAGELCQRLSSPRLEEIISFAPNDSRGLSEVEWQQHKELRQRLSAHFGNQSESMVPVISACSPLEELLNARAGMVYPGLLIAVSPYSENLHREKKFQPSQNYTKPLNGPLARISADTPEGLIEEALAAIEAAWPEINNNCQ